MNASFAERSVVVVRNLIPGFATLVLLFLSVVPLSTPNSALVLPPFALMGIYFWSVYRPDLLPVAAVFGIGLMQDMLSGGPPGLFAAAYLGVHAVMSWQRRFFVGKSFPVEWLGFALVVPPLYFAVWLVGSIYYLRPLPAGEIVVQGLLALAFYPAITWALGRLRAAARI
jgi:rod shape-determining protein MreD